MEESVGLEFKWGKKKGVGGKKKDVQFYESFTYDGDEYRLYDCVFVGDSTQPDFTEPFLGMIIKIWDHTNKRANILGHVKLLWFFKPSEILPYLDGVPDVLPNELFLASGEGRGLANVNRVEAIGGKCSVLYISKEKRNPLLSDEEIKSSDFVFRRAFDVGSCKVVDMIDDKIAGVDVKFLLNRVGCEKQATARQKIESDINGNSDSLKPNGPSASDAVRRIAIESSDWKESSYGCKQEKGQGHNQLATKQYTLAEERSYKDSGVQDNEHVSCEASGPRGNHCDGKAQESEVKKHFTKQKSMSAEERYSHSCIASGSRGNHSNFQKPQVDDVKKQLTKQKSMPADERYRKESNGLDDRPQKKQKLDGYVTAPDGRNTTIFQNISSDGKMDIGRDTGSFQRPKDRMEREQAPPEKASFSKKRDLGVSVSEEKDTKSATEKGFSKKPSSDGKLVNRAEDKMLVDDYERNYQVIEVRRRPDAGKTTWFRNLPWEEESMRDAENWESLVLLQNLDPSYTSDEVEDIVYSALNEQCEARMMECTLVTTSYTGEALVIFKTREVAQRVIRRLDEGCLLLSNGRPLVAAFAKITPPGKPSSFSGHIKLHKTQMRREMRDAVSTSHCSQSNTLEFDMAMEWCLHRTRQEQVTERMSKRQLEERNVLRINFKPKRP